MTALFALVVLPTPMDGFVVVQRPIARVSTTSSPIVVTASSSTTTTTRLDAAATVGVELPLGLQKTILQEGGGFEVQRGDIATLKYACYVVNDDENANDDQDEPPFCKATQQKMVVGDGTMIPGWEAAMRSGMRIGERAIFRITDPALGYGAAGVPPLVPPNAVLELDVQVLDAQPPTANIDFDNLALDSTPTTAADIARAYEVRQAAKGTVVEEEGFQAFLNKAKNFYFFGLFEGETGERAPWFLRPSITFPLAFAIVGATFYATFAGGGISERGAQTTDELDEIILSSAALVQLTVHALSTTSVNLGL